MRTILPGCTAALMLGIAFLLPSADPAMAMELSFSVIAPTPGSISYAGTGGALTGTNINVDSVVGTSTPANADITSTCLSCVLNFTSGSNTSTGGGSWQFGSGGSITITGGVDLQGGTDIPLGSTLLSGTFGSATVQDLPGTIFKVTFGSFTDTKHASLLSYYGLPSGDYEGGLTLMFSGQNSGTGDAISSTSLFSGSIVNAPAAVPLPAAALLFGSGLAGLLVSRLRKSVA